VRTGGQRDRSDKQYVLTAEREKSVKESLRQLAVRLGYHLIPGLLIIGAQRAGTTSLFHYLSKHPSLIPSRVKEVGFFCFETNFVKGYSWYHNHFPLPHEVRRDSVAFEATPEYLYYPHCPERVCRYNEKLKLIIILRDPVERAFSAWNMFRNFKTDPNWVHLTEYQGFPQSIMSEMKTIDKDNPLGYPLEPSYVRRGIYVIQIERYLKFFPRSAIYITENTMLRKETRRVLQEIADFLGIPQWEPQETREGLNSGRYEGQVIPGDIKALLGEFYRPYSERLFQLIGREFEWSH
jgi:hypothetical protein